MFDVTTYTISDVARRSGFSPATLRYYEDLGLLRPPDRTPGGYRLYDDHALDRLAFIARAKQLGCSLDEITDLSVAWEGGECGPVQERLQSLVATKLHDTAQRITELTAFSTQLTQAARVLGSHRPDGPCDERCGCVGEPVDMAARVDSAPVRLTSKPETEMAEMPIVCTLGAGQVGSRLDDWQSMLADVVSRDPIDGGVRVGFDGNDRAGELAQLAAAEQECCRFFDFSVTIDRRGLALEVRAPHDAGPLVDALFGAPQ